MLDLINFRLIESITNINIDENAKSVLVYVMLIEYILPGICASYQEYMQ